MKTHLLESVNSSRRPGTFASHTDREDERELIRLMARHLDTDDMLYLLKLDPTARCHEDPCDCEVHRLFGRMRNRKPVQKSKKKKIEEAENRRRRKPMVFGRIDVYAIVLLDGADPALRLEATDAPAASMHPEVLEGECFLGNIDVLTFGVINWKSKRLGTIAYSQTGTKLQEYYRPLFVSMQELLEAGLPPDMLVADHDE